MKRDMDLLREILLKCESTWGWVPKIMVTATPQSFHDPELLAQQEHILLLEEHGLIQIREAYDPSLVQLVLTWDGHDFCDEIRDPTMFAKIKKIVGKDSWTIPAMRAAYKRLKRIADIIDNTITNWVIFSILAGIAWLFGFLRFW